ERYLIAAMASGVIAEAVLPLLRDKLGFGRAVARLIDLPRGEVDWLAAAGRRRVHVGPGVRIPLRLMSDVERLSRGETQLVDTTLLPHDEHVEALLASGVPTYMVVPMIVREELIGAVSFGGAPGDFS